MTRSATLAFAMLVTLTIFAFWMGFAVAVEAVRGHEFTTEILDATVSCGSLEKPHPQGVVYRGVDETSFDLAAEQREAARCVSRIAVQERWFYLIVGGFLVGNLGFVCVGIGSVRQADRRQRDLPPLVLRRPLPVSRSDRARGAADLSTPEAVLLVRGELDPDREVWTLCWYGVLDAALRGLIGVERRRLPGLIPFRQFVVTEPTVTPPVPPLLRPLMDNLRSMPLERDAVGRDIRRFSLVMQRWETLDTAIGFESLVLESLGQAGLAERGEGTSFTLTVAGEAQRAECLAGQRDVAAIQQRMDSAYAVSPDDEFVLGRAFATLPAWMVVNGTALARLARAGFTAGAAPGLPDGFDLESAENVHAVLTDRARERLS